MKLEIWVKKKKQFKMKKLKEYQKIKAHPQGLNYKFKRIT